MNSKKHITTERLLTSVKHIVNHQTEVEKIKGEQFNVFSILGMERYENQTHSAFLAELLNPGGSHLKGPIFLELFLGLSNINHIDLNTAKVMVEYHIGMVDSEYSQGGRIDIYIVDGANNSVSIENKIDAGDQPKQIERYCNHNTPLNRVIYLTKDGKSPSLESSGTKQHGVDFVLCSYKTDIIKWLELCLKESANEPILRETIKQYLILIKKITHTMESQSEQELIELMLQYFDEAGYVADNFSKIRQNAGEAVRLEVVDGIKEILGDEYWVEAGSPTTNTYSQIWIGLNLFPESKLYFGIESFSGLGWHDGNVFLGVYNNANGQKSKFSSSNGNSNTNAYWVDQYQLKDIQGMTVNFKNSELLKKYYSWPEFKSELVRHIVNEIHTYIKIKSPALLQFLQTESPQKV